MRKKMTRTNSSFSIAIHSPPNCKSFFIVLPITLWKAKWLKGGKEAAGR